MLDNFIKSIHEKENIVPSCKNKCSGCCKYPIWATEVEYLYISEWITRKVTKDTTMDQLHKRFDQWLQDMGDLLDCFEPGNIQKSLEYTHKNIKCPFLLNHSCSIYEARPVYTAPHCQDTIFEI